MIEEKKKSTLITEKELFRRCEAEGIDFSRVQVIGPRWAESAPKADNVRSALVGPDLIIREDGSAVLLDGAMAHDSLQLAQDHLDGKSNPNNLPWEQLVESVSTF